MTCKSQYTATEFLAIMAIGFVQGNLPPSINEKGEPTYVIQRVSQETIRSGCAVTLMLQATANESFLKDVNHLNTHQACPVTKLHRETDIEIWDLVKFEESPLVQCYGVHVGFDPRCDYCEGTKSRVINFFQSLQSCHDNAAKVWWSATKHGGVNSEVADKMFRILILKELQDVANEYEIPWSAVEVEILNLGNSLKERVPAITQPAVAV